jgi:hypothetical protein
MHWLAKVIYHHFDITLVFINVFSRSREFEITTRSVNRNGITQTTMGDLEEEEEENNGLVHGWRKRKVAVMPSFGAF